MKIYLAVMVVVCLGAGCASVPQTLKHTGAELLEQCPKDIRLENDEQSVLLASIETDLYLDEFYLLLENDTGDKHLMMLSPRKFGMPTGDDIKCNAIKPGNYRITKAFGVIRSTRQGLTMEEKVDYKYSRDFHAPPNRATYLGHFILSDPRMKGKDYFGRMGAMISGTFKGRGITKINVNDSIEEDSAFMLKKYKHIQIEQIINNVR